MSNKVIDILESIKTDAVNEYLFESVEKRGKKFYAIKNNKNKDIIPGTKENGYKSLENAVRAMMDETNAEFKRMPFNQKQERINKYIKRWKKQNDYSEPRPKKKHGFTEIN